MAKRSRKRSIEKYEHADKERVNNPPVGLVTPDTDKDAGKTTYAYDPHLDPQLVWAGKAEHTSFEVPTVSLHVHERIDPRTIIEAVRKRNGSEPQLSLFASPEENPPIRQAIEFYKHKHNWTNRLIAGDSLLVMNSLLEKEGLGGQVQMVYIDPPYGIRYGSNFQPFVNQRSVSEADKDEDLTNEPETLKAFRDTWELALHSYLSYLRDRLYLCKQLLHPSGSLFFQISDKNLHFARNVLDEVFGAKSHVVTIPIKKKGAQKSSLLDPVNDYLVWYSKTPRSDQKAQAIKFRNLFVKKPIDADLLSEYRFIEMQDGQVHAVSECPDPTGQITDYRNNPRKLLQDYPDVRFFRSNPLKSGGERKNQSLPFTHQGKTHSPGRGRCWKTTVRTHDGSPSGMERLAWADRLIVTNSEFRFRSYFDDFGYEPLSNWWDGLGGASNPIFVVQTNPEIVKRCILMTTDPGDLVFDPTCGGGTTAYVAEQWGRRWITCDTSRVAVALAKLRLMTANFDYYKLAHPEEGVSSGFSYEIVPHITLGSIANNPEIQSGASRDKIRVTISKYADQETLFDRPHVNGSKARVTGPFTVEAVPAPTVKPLDDIEEDMPLPADESVARTGETQRQGDWREELLKTGIRGKSGQRIKFSRMEPLAGTRWLHAEGETRPCDAGVDGFREEGTAWNPERVVVSFGPDHALLEQRQVALAIEEAQNLVPKPKIIVFAAFQFDPEAGKDIDETKWPGVTLLKAQMNADLLTADLKNKHASNESFWLIGQPEVEIEKIGEGEDAGKFRVLVHGFDYYNTKTGNIESGGADKIAMWMLDPDYDGRSLFARQVFFIANVMQDGLEKLARNLKAEIDEELIQSYFGTVSLPFRTGEHRRVAVKIIDDRGIESLAVLSLD